VDHDSRPCYAKKVCETPSQWKKFGFGDKNLKIGGLWFKLAWAKSKTLSPN
jgi:hypothetical protein